MAPRIVNRARMISWLTELDERSAGASTVCLPPGVPSAVSPDIPEDLVRAAATSKTGVVLLSAPKHFYLVLPPFPITESLSAAGYCTAPLLAQLKQDREIALVLIRLGSYAIGVCHGERLVTSKVGTGLVHSRHRQGGSSSNRFRRHREKQIETFLTRVCGHVREQIEPHARSIDYIAYGGAWTTILELKKQCEFLSRLKATELPPLLDIADPRQPVLEQAVARVWSSTIFEWHEEDGRAAPG